MKSLGSLFNSLINIIKSLTAKDFVEILILLKKNFLLNKYLELPKEFLELTNLSFQLTNFDIEEDEEGLIEKLEKINFHRNHKKVDEIIKLKFFKNKRDYLIKLKDNILSKDFSVLGEAPKKDMMKMKKNLYIESIMESK